LGAKYGIRNQKRAETNGGHLQAALREKYLDQRGLVEEFIVEIEGAPKNCDVTRWSRFTDIKDIKKEMLKRFAMHSGLKPEAQKMLNSHGERAERI
jgi:hypothetical protein